MEKTNCKNCGDEIEYVPCVINGKTMFIPTLCDPCEKKEIEELERNANSRAKDAARNRFLDEIATSYRNTDFSRISPVLQKAVSEWKFSPRGLGLIGTSGSCKTRAAVLILQRMAEEGKSVMFLTATSMAQAAIDQFHNDQKRKDEASNLLDRALSTSVLLLDDLGKNRMTDRSEETLYEILEHRTSWEQPTIWTSNSGARDLHERFSKDRADAILRRLIEFSTLVTIKIP